jgi:hypothetical protein
MSRHYISVIDAQAAIKAHEQAHGHEISETNPRSLAFDAQAVADLVAKVPEGGQIRIHHAIHKGHKTVMLAAENVDGQMVEAINDGRPCPPIC